MPADPRDRSRLTARTKHLLEDALHKLRGGPSLKNTFVLLSLANQQLMKVTVTNSIALGLYMTFLFYV